MKAYKFLIRHRSTYGIQQHILFVLGKNQNDATNYLKNKDYIVLRFYSSFDAPHLKDYKKSCILKRIKPWKDWAKPSKYFELDGFRYVPEHNHHY